MCALLARHVLASLVLFDQHGTFWARLSEQHRVFALFRCDAFVLDKCEPVMDVLAWERSVRAEAASPAEDGSAITLSCAMVLHGVAWKNAIAAGFRAVPKLLAPRDVFFGNEGLELCSGVSAGKQVDIDDSQSALTPGDAAGNCAFTL
jgi:hypothetical protein